jgi:hypothetical protein
MYCQALLWHTGASGVHSGDTPAHNEGALFPMGVTRSETACITRDWVIFTIALFWCQLTCKLLGPGSAEQKNLYNLLSAHSVLAAAQGHMFLATAQRKGSWKHRGWLTCWCKHCTQVCFCVLCKGRVTACYQGLGRERGVCIPGNWKGEGNHFLLGAERASW